MAFVLLFVIGGPIIEMCEMCFDRLLLLLASIKLNNILLLKFAQPTAASIEHRVHGAMHACKFGCNAIPLEGRAQLTMRRPAAAVRRRNIPTYVLGYFRQADAVVSVVLCF